jgi:hypothetical protein
MISARLAVAALAVMTLAACGRSTPRAADAGKELSIWQPVGSWSGRGNRQTDAFPGETGTFRIQWKAEPIGAPASPPGREGTLKITLYSAVSGRPLLAAVDQKGPGGGTTYLNEDPRTFFFVVESADLEWSFSADEQLGVVEKPVER